MIRESVRVGETYALLHGSVRDRSKARPFIVTDVPDEGSNIEGHYVTETGTDGPHIVSVRLLRSSWAAWVLGVNTPTRPYKRKPENVAGWLRRISQDPDASNDLRGAAQRQLASIGGTR